MGDLLNVGIQMMHFMNEIKNVWENPRVEASQVGSSRVQINLNILCLTRQGG